MTQDRGETERGEGWKESRDAHYRTVGSRTQVSVVTEVGQDRSKQQRGEPAGFKEGSEGGERGGMGFQAQERRDAPNKVSRASRAQEQERRDSRS